MGDGHQQASLVSPPECDEVASGELGVDTRVCVRNKFLGDWSSGFEVVEVLSGGYRLRRISDGLAFPDVFPSADVRPDRRRQSDRGVSGSYLDRHF